VETPIVKGAGLIALVAVDEKRKTPSTLVPEVSKTTEVNGNFSQTPKVLLAGLAQHLKLPSSGLLWLNESIDIAQSAPEADIEPGILSGIMLLR
jgi:hypothetical protein